MKPENQIADADNIPYVLYVYLGRKSIKLIWRMFDFQVLGILFERIQLIDARNDYTCSRIYTIILSFFGSSLLFFSAPSPSALICNFLDIL